VTLEKRGPGRDSNRPGPVINFNFPLKRLAADFNLPLRSYSNIRQDPRFVMPDIDNRLTRRTFFIGVASSLICAPAIVRAENLMPVRGLPLQLFIPKRRILKTMGDWYQFCFYNNLDNDLKAGRAMTYDPVGGKPISVADGHQIIARARALGWLEP
jgi:hypothetical protein